ncbi:DEAD/DEAH box helicase [Siccirubricoccus sp. G192]|uniref:DEAD/DEAH box helicase n=1 Tax=Siccirubricoccus sp. G192 TaxID=2849651 RepID=UPI001C2BD4DD|nr:DEAD/DEAH box helicase [Siccirubricoccus sp. G192]MBV1800479.1 DEAD/DEAH box helicase [Siccirubricoccus sp. G192]
MSAAFDALHPALRYHIVSTLGWPDLRPTQADAVGPVMAGEDVLLLAPTAGGKTEAAAFPLISRIATEGGRGLSAVYVCPLKALLNNLAPRLERYASFVGLRVGLWHGDVGEPARRRMLRDPPEILLTTPESLEAMLISARLDHVDLLGGIRSVVVDELHAFAGDDRGWHLLFLLSRLERLTGRQIQRIGLTATVGNPSELLDWLTLGRGGRVLGPTCPVADGEVTADHVGSVRNAVTVIARLHRGERRLVFVDSRTRVEEIAAGLRAAGVRTFVSHASLSLDERRQAEAAFVAEPDCVIVATSTLELGLDVGDLDRVIQIGAPPSVASFLQRMGRTGRRSGTTRNCLFLAIDNEELLACLALATLWREGVVEAIAAPPRPSHIFAQQVMALVLQEKGVARADIGRWLGAAADAVPEADRQEVLAHMLANGILAEDIGILGLGSVGEREFGRRHFGDLVAAFSQPLLLAVRHGPLELGSVHPASIAPGHGGGPAVISLGGRSWKVTDVDWRRRIISVLPTERGGRSRWLGSGRPMSSVVANAVERVVAGTIPGCRLSRRAEAALEEIRARLEFVDADALPLVADGEGRVVLWGFAGGAAMASIAAGLGGLGLTVSAFDDFTVTVKIRDPSGLVSAIDAIDADAVHPRLPENIEEALKFGLCLPEVIARAVLEGRTSDPAAVAAIRGRLRRLIHLGYPEATPGSSARRDPNGS